MGWREIGLFAAMVAAWFVLNRWVLPSCGVGTCMSGSCAVDSCPTASDQMDRLPGVPRSEPPFGGDLRDDANGPPVEEPAEPSGHPGEGGIRQ